VIGFVLGFVVVGAWSGSWFLGVMSGAALGALSVWYFPTTKCRWWKCRGGKVFDSGGKNWRACRLCGGSGRRTRWVARVLGGGIDA